LDVTTFTPFAVTQDFGTDVSGVAARDFITQQNANQKRRRRSSRLSLDFQSTLQEARIGHAADPATL
jgi:hypothetical protein